MYTELLQDFLKATPLKKPTTYVSNLYKTAYSKNITIEDWNTLLQQVVDTIGAHTEVSKGFEAISKDLENFPIDVQGEDTSRQIVFKAPITSPITFGNTELTEAQLKHMSEVPIYWTDYLPDGYPSKALVLGQPGGDIADPFELWVKTNSGQTQTITVGSNGIINSLKPHYVHGLFKALGGFKINDTELTEEQLKAAIALFDEGVATEKYVEAKTAVDETELNEMLDEVMPLPLTFSVANEQGDVLHTYTFLKDMTWGEFVNSAYNIPEGEDGHLSTVFGGNLTYHHVANSGSEWFEYVGDGGYTYLSSSDAIKPNTTYLAWT